MKFNKIEMTAILSMAHVMTIADGKIEDEETRFISSEIAKFGIPLSDFKAIFIDGIDMDPSYAAEIISKMTDEQKLYVLSFLGTLMAVDKDIDDTEMALWKSLSQLCGLPAMSVTDAISYMAAID